MSESMTSADEGIERVGLALGAALASVGPPAHLDNPHTLLGEVAGQPGTSINLATSADHQVISARNGRAQAQNGSYAETSLGPRTSCRSTGQDQLPDGNPRSDVREAPAPIHGVNTILADP
jgi:hypothetical protein